MKKLLILNGSHSDVPLIQAGKKLGFHVITTGNEPRLIGHRYADEYHKVDFSDKQGILSLSRKLNIDAICSCANDFGAITASYVAEKMGLPGHDPYEITLTLHLKHRFKEFALANNISTPHATSYLSPEKAYEGLDKLSFPLIIKPVDLTGGKGISKANSKEEYIKAVEYAISCSRMNQILVEEFIQGTYHSFTTFVRDRKIVFSFSDNEYSFLNPYLVTTSAAPAIGIEKVRSQLIEESERIIDLLSLCDGIFHIQYIQAGSKAWIIEITRRCSGDFYPNPVNYATGLDWAEWIVKAESGFDCGDFPKVEQRGFFGRHCIMSRKNGTIKNINISPELDGNITDEFMILNKGDKIDQYMVNKLAVIFLRYGSMEEMIKKTMNINNLVSVDLE
jgi:biotin carboxylase